MGRWGPSSPGTLPQALSSDWGAFRQASHRGGRGWRAGALSYLKPPRLHRGPSKEAACIPRTQRASLTGVGLLPSESRHQRTD